MEIILAILAALAMKRSSSAPAGAGPAPAPKPAARPPIAVALAPRLASQVRLPSSPTGFGFFTQTGVKGLSASTSSTDAGGLAAAEQKFSVDYDRLPSDRKRQAVDALNAEFRNQCHFELGLRPEMTGSQIVQKLTEGTGACAGYAAGAYVCGGEQSGARCAAIGKAVGAFLGRELGPYVVEAKDWLQRQASEGVDWLKEQATDAWNAINPF